MMNGIEKPSEKLREQRLEVLGRANEYVRNLFRNHDGSHDYNHVMRVHDLALSLAEGDRNAAGSDFSEVRQGGRQNPSFWNDEDWFVLELSSILHDVDDRKYARKTEDQNLLSSFFNDTRKSLNVSAVRDDDDEEDCLNTSIEQRVKTVIDNMSYSTEIAYSREAYAEILSGEPCLAYVQDADRLDAIGAVGIARAFTFGGVKARALYSNYSLRMDYSSCLETPTREQYLMQEKKTEGQDLVHAASSQNRDGNKHFDTLAHFYEKLFLIEDKIKTPAGRRMAEERHKFMLLYVDQLKSEVSGSR